MNQAFEEEDKSHYLYENEERKRHSANFKEGKLYSSVGKPFINEWLLYVLDENDILYVVPAALEWNHSFFLAGQPIRAAGFIETNEHAELIRISNESGHYTPMLSQMLYALDFFYHNISCNDNIDFVIYESHDEVQTKHIISEYDFESLVLADQAGAEIKLEDLLLQNYPAKKSNNTKTKLTGYCENITVENEEQIKFKSRYGLASQKHIVETELPMDLLMKSKNSIFSIGNQANIVVMEEYQKNKSKQFK